MLFWVSIVELIFNIKHEDTLGPTGCGKSTLLDILADRKDRRDYDGRVLINGCLRPASSVYRYMVGYVVQDDIFSGTLTVRENITFSANLRLPRSVLREDRLQRVNRIIQQLGLMECADTRMGTESLRGVSGGERKRTCIAMEMVLSPKILFLDEPTTGKPENKTIIFFIF
jgi:ATP-binding cassette subfamily G (WHITE) protein 2